jgi:hypothetical protein
VAELSCLARTVNAQDVEILAFHSTGSCSNAPIQAGNLLTGKVKTFGTASATSPNHHRGCYCTAASGDTLTTPQDCEGTPHA